MKPVLGITLTNAWSVKNLAVNGTLGRFHEHFRLLIWLPARWLNLSPDSYGEPIFTADDVVLRPLVEFTPSFWYRSGWRMQKAALFAEHDISTESITMNAQRKRRTVLEKAIYDILRSRNCGPLRRLARNVGGSLRSKGTPRKLYPVNSYEPFPDLALLTQPLVQLEDPLFHCLKTRRIPVATMIHSWDNLTSKGVLHNDYDLVMVWNAALQSELLNLYPSYDEGRVKIIGVPRFDIYRQNLPPQYERPAFFRALGLDPNQRLLLFANTATPLFPHQPAVISHICEAMRSGRLPNDLQLLVRCHPHDDPAVYDKFRKIPRVAVWPLSGQHHDFLHSFPTHDDDWVLAASIKHSVACVNAASTIALEAALCDIPIISVAYDGDNVLPYHDSVQSAYDFEHQKPFMQLNGTEMCRSEAELIGAVNEALSNPEKRTDARRKIRDDLLGGEGLASERLVDTIIQFWQTRRQADGGLRHNPRIQSNGHKGNA